MSYNPPKMTPEEWLRHVGADSVQIISPHYDEFFDDEESPYNNEPPPYDEPPPDEPNKPSRGTMHGRLRVLGMDDIDTAPPRTYLLKGVISPNETSVWVGAPKCGKSFLLMHVAYMLSLGRSVFGRRVKPTKILYVAAEGEGGIAKRLAALRNKHGASPNFHFIAQPIDLLRESGHKFDVIDAAEAVGAQLIVVDTLNRALAGGDENSSQDMGTFITNVGHIKAATHAHIAVIHHGTKSSEGRAPRGHGSLEGADDALIEVVKQSDGTRLATLVHSKDDADGIAWGFKLNVVELGEDEDGDQITTLIVEEKQEAPDRVQKPAKLSPSETNALSALDKAMAQNPMVATVGSPPAERSVTTETLWREMYYDTTVDEKQEAKRQSFKRGTAGLQAKGRIVCEKQYVWRPDAW